MQQAIMSLKKTTVQGCCIFNLGSHPTHKKIQCRTGKQGGLQRGSMHVPVGGTRTSFSSSGPMLPMLRAPSNVIVIWRTAQRCQAMIAFTVFGSTTSR